MRALKKITAKLHLWLGLASGLLVLFLGITGCILAFQREIENVTQPYRFTQVQAKPLLPPSALKDIADKALPGKKAHSVSYEPGICSTRPCGDWKKRICCLTILASTSPKPTNSIELFFRKSLEIAKQARVIHDSILKHELLSGDIQFRKKK
jgi:hypothetical protein